MAVDHDTYTRYLQAEQRAKELGLTLFEVLDHNRLLLTKKRKHNVEVAVLEDVVRRLDRQSPNKLMAHYFNRVDGTPAEMFEALKMWLEAVYRNLANETLEEL
jgi:hypothetical protein